MAVEPVSYVLWYLIRSPLATCKSNCILTLCVSFSALEDAVPGDAVQLYTDACILLEEDDKEQMAFDLYRAATNVYIKLEK